ncbi:MAG: hypothetical protein ABI598_06650, partial [Chloroflexota bacterium]
MAKLKDRFIGPMMLRRRLIDAGTTVSDSVRPLQTWRRLALLAASASLVAACTGNVPIATPTPTVAGAPATSTLPSASAGDSLPATTDAPAPPPDLSARPLTWFAPLPPMPGRTGSTDFMDQFAVEAPWTMAGSHVQVFKLYGEWVAYHATAQQLQAAIAGISARHMALAVEVGPLDPPADCGIGVESFAGVAEGRRIAERIRA